MTSPILRLRFAVAVAICLPACSPSDQAGGLAPSPGTVATVDVTPPAITLTALGQSMSLAAVARDTAGTTVTANPVVWSSSNPAIASTDQNGSVTAVANGPATISATVGGITGTASVLVAQTVTGISLTPAAASVAVGDTVQLIGTPHDANGHPVAAGVVWSSANSAVATVDGNGTVVGVATGTTTISATSSSQVATAAITVTSGGGGGGGGTVLFAEDFEDGNFAARGWYDDGGVTITSAEAHSGNSSLEFRFSQGAAVPTGTGMRHLFTETGSIYLSYWVKYSTNWVGSGDPYHPHEFYFLTNLAGPYAAPAWTNLTVYVEHNYQNGGYPILAAQDGQNIDVSQINVDLTGITENRAVHGCNGEPNGGPTDCYMAGSTYRNGKRWLASQPQFLPTPGPRYQNDWHFVEAHFRLNTVQGGIGQFDGVVQYWFDGQLVIDEQAVQLRTGAHPAMAFNQLLVAPFIGSGSPVSQTMWLDDLEVKTAR